MKVSSQYKVTVIIPTYNEAGNIGELLDSIFQQIGENKNYSFTVLVVDDNSPDGTARVVEELKKSNVSLLQRKFREGLGNAYLDGFRYAMNELKADVIFEMDGDFSHSPEYIPLFLNEIEEGCDFVIGSRHVSGGAIPEWGFHRRLISYLGNLFARTVLPLEGVSDCTSGYRAIKVSLLEKISLSDINVRGYAFQLSLLYSAIRNGAIIREIPIVFKKRRSGKSKLGILDVSEFIFEVFRLRIRG